MKGHIDDIRSFLAILGFVPVSIGFTQAPGLRQSGPCW